MSFWRDEVGSDAWHLGAQASLLYLFSTSFLQIFKGRRVEVPMEDVFAWELLYNHYQLMTQHTKVLHSHVVHIQSVEMISVQAQFSIYYKLPHYFITHTPISQMSLLSPSNPESLLDSTALKTLKQRVLKQAYEQELTKKSERTAISTNREPSEQDSSSVKISRSVGNLSQRPNSGSRHDLEYAAPRSFQKREFDRRRLMQEKDMLSSVQRHASLQAERQREARDEYKRQLQQEIKRKQSVRELSKVQERQLEQSKLHREESYRNKQSSFKEFYDNAYKFRDQVANGYLQYVSASKERQEREKERERYDLEQNRNLLKVQMLEQHKVKREKRQQLKRALEQQMLESNSHKANQLAQFKNRGYVKFDSNNYNPIYNPIDYKMDLNNRYVLSQLIN